jgi:hypothetical protein
MMLRGRTYDVERLAIEALYRPVGSTGSGITQLTGDVVAGPGSGSQVSTIKGAATGIQVGSDTQAFGGGTGGIIGITNATAAPTSVPAGGMALYAGTVSGIQSLLVAAQGIAFPAFITSPIIAQAPTAAAGANMAIESQPSTGSTGGNLALAAGSGSTGPNNGTVSLVTGGATGNAIISAGPNGVAYGSAAVALSATGTTTLTQAQYQFPLLECTGTLTGQITLVFPNVAGFWMLDVSQVVGNSHTVTIESGSGSATITLGAGASSTSTLYFVSCTGSNQVTVK